jgi:hypothetical protein
MMASITSSLGQMFTWEFIQEQRMSLSSTLPILGTVRLEKCRFANFHHHLPWSENATFVHLRGRLNMEEKNLTFQPSAFWDNFQSEKKEHMLEFQELLYDAEDDPFENQNLRNLFVHICI